MFKTMKTTLLAAVMATSALASTAAIADEPSKSDRVVIGTSIYAGWMPWYQIKDSGIMDQVNKDWRHGIPQLPPEQSHENGRISIIVWGWRD